MAQGRKKKPNIVHCGKYNNVKGFLTVESLPESFYFVQEATVYINPFPLEQHRERGKHLGATV